MEVRKFVRPRGEGRLFEAEGMVQRTGLAGKREQESTAGPQTGDKALKVVSSE